MGDRAGLVEHDGVEPAAVLEHLGALDDDAQLCSPTGSDEDGQRGGESQSAGAGDDQHRDRGGECVGCGVCQDQPTEQRHQSNSDSDGHEHGRHAVGEPLDLGTAALRLVDKADDLRQGSVGTDPRGLDQQRAVGVDSGTNDFVAGSHLDRHRLAGDHRHIDRGVPFEHHPVGGDLLAGAHPESHPHGQVVDSDLGAVFEHGGAGTEVRKRSDRLPGPAGGTYLEPLSEQDQGDDHRARLEVDLRVNACCQHHRRPGPGRQSTDRDQRVHGDEAMSQVGGGDTVEPPARPVDDRCGQQQRGPLPSLEAQRTDHRDCRDDDREHRGEPKP